MNLWESMRYRKETRLNIEMSTYEMENHYSATQLSMRYIEDKFLFPKFKALENVNFADASYDIYLIKFLLFGIE